MIPTSHVPTQWTTETLLTYLLCITADTKDKQPKHIEDSDSEEDS